MTTSKSVKLFNLEERKLSTGTAITEVDIFQWKNTLIDNLRKEPEHKDFCSESAKWDFENVENRGFRDRVAGDGEGQKKAERVHSMLTKIASYAPKSIVREIIRRTRCLADIWNIARDWAGIQSSGSKHLDYYKTKMSYLKIDKEETKQEFFYRLRDAMEDTLIRSSDGIIDDGQTVTVNEDMTPSIKSMVVLDWLDAIGGPNLVEHVHRVYAKELESCTLSSLQSRMWKNMDALIRECETLDEVGKIFRTKSETVTEPATCCNVDTSSNRRGNYQRGFRGQRGRRGQNINLRPMQRKTLKTSEPSGCKLCKANGSPNFKSHDITDCWLLNENERSKISQNYVKAQALIATHDDENVEECGSDDANEEDYENEENYDDQD